MFDCDRKYVIQGHIDCDNFQEKMIFLGSYLFTTIYEKRNFDEPALSKYFNSILF